MLAIASVVAGAFASAPPAASDDGGWNPLKQIERQRATRSTAARPIEREPDTYGSRAPTDGDQALDGYGRDSTTPSTPWYRDRSGADPAGETASRDGSTAQDGFNPTGSSRYIAGPVDGAPVFGDGDTVKRTDLVPLSTSPTSASGGGTSSATDWQGMSPDNLRRRLDAIGLPVRSWSLRAPLVRMLSSAGTSGATSEDAAMRALQADALIRHGALNEARAVLGDDIVSLPTVLLDANISIGLGDPGPACGRIKEAASKLAEQPNEARGSLILLAGYCAVAAGNPSGAGLSAQLARDSGVGSPVTIAIMEALAAGTPHVRLPQGPVTVLDARLLALLPGALTAEHVKAMTLPALVALAIDDKITAAVRIEAAERAAAANAISAADLAGAYLSADALRRGDPETAATGRARLWVAIDKDRTLYQRTRDIRTLLDGARRDGFYPAALRLVATILSQIRPVAEVGWFAETAIEAAIMAGRLDLAEQWTAFAERLDADGAIRFSHWRALIDIADADGPANTSERGQDLVALERIAIAGRIPPDTLHRLATVLDALRYNVPIGLWDAANRAPQPTAGHLPSTGVLAELNAASKAGQIARTVLLTAEAIGENGPNGAHMIAIGDGIRALSRAGLEADARRLATEAVFDLWPRVGSRP